ncbi:hypothetical protein [Herbidospora cretacea]|uniref:hypothetical protein n=1 Tax=Herbidospora cretacea TaxID=28444 RepID=UPI0012DC53AE|nr:hypothetical protein [Herbidospora cretacea]
MAAEPYTRVLCHAALVKSFVAGMPVVVLPHGRDRADDAVFEDRSFADSAARLGGPSAPRPSAACYPASSRKG